MRIKVQEESQMTDMRGRRRPRLLWAVAIIAAFAATGVATAGDGAAESVLNHSCFGEHATTA
jgi:hypothetical protein